MKKLFPPEPEYWAEFRRLFAPAEERPVTQQRREQLATEAARHREKAEKAEERLRALEGIPDQDPFPDGTVLKVQAGQYTYALLRAGGLWYATGITGPERYPWWGLVDWLISRNVSVVTLMQPGEATSLSALEPPAEPSPADDVEILPVKACDYVSQEDHEPHDWRGVRLGSGDAPRIYWCRGV